MGAGEILEELNAQQRLAATNYRDHILLLAPAGTGKTNTLACRIALLLEEGRVEPEEILCLTFTNKTCREMESRIALRAGEQAKHVVVRTFHAFCYDLIKAEAKRHSDLFADFTIFDESDSREVLADLTGDAWPMKAIYGLVMQLKEARAAYGLEAPTGESGQEVYRAVLQKLLEKRKKAVEALASDGSYGFSRPLYEGWLDWGPRVTAEYDGRLRDMHALDFTDLIVQADVLLANPAIATRWTRRFSYIHIDEVQDTSLLEYSILARIFGSSRILLAGDFFQTIYEWRGSSPEKILKSFESTHEPKRIALRENYRSTTKLLQASFACLTNLFPERVRAIYPDGLRAMSKELGKNIVLRGASDIADEAQWIYYKIQQLGTTEYSRICVLTRSNYYNKSLTSYFRTLSMRVPVAERIPFLLAEEQKFYRRQEIKDVLAFLKLLENKHDGSSFIRILNRYGEGIGPAAIQKISSKPYRLAGVRITDLADMATLSRGDPFAGLLEALDEGNVVVFDVESTGVDITRDEIIQIAGIRVDWTGKILDTFNRVLRPTQSVGDSVRVHHMTDDWLSAHGEEAAEVLRDFCAFAEDSVIVGHNVTYDLGILASHLGRLGLPQLRYPMYYDTLDIFRRFYPNLPNYKLEYLGEFCNTANRSSHDALDDIRATADILHFAVEKNILPRAEERHGYIQEWAARFYPLAKKLAAFRAEASDLRPYQLIAKIVVDMGIDAYYHKQKEEQRVENLRSLYVQARGLDDVSASPQDSLARFLQYTALSNTELDASSRRQEIPIITIHQAKGAEFDYVFLAGLQEGTFPAFRSSEGRRLEEEKRLFYVAITRPRKELFLSWCQTIYGRSQSMSRIVSSIPKEYITNEK